MPLPFLAQGMFHGDPEAVFQVFERPVLVIWCGLSAIAPCEGECDDERSVNH